MENDPVFCRRCSFGAAKAYKFRVVCMKGGVFRDQLFRCVWSVYAKSGDRLRDVRRFGDALWRIAFRIKSDLRKR